MTNKRKRVHGGTRPGAGRPARSGTGAARKYTLLLADDERALLTRLAAKLALTESETMRLGLVQLAERHCAEPIPAQHMGRKIDARTNLRKKP